MARMSPALKQALAYVGIRGHYPKGIHVNTRLAAYDYVANADYDRTRRFYDLTAEAEALVRDHPFSIGHRFLTARGFKPVVYPRFPSLHWIDYRHDNGDEAHLFRGGSVQILPDGSYQGRQMFTHQQVKEAV